MQNTIQSLLETGIYGNSAERLLLSLLTFLVLYLVFLQVLPFVLKRLRSPTFTTDQTVLGTVITFVQKIPSLVWGSLALVIALRWLMLPPRIEYLVAAVSLFLVVILGVLLVQKILEHVLSHFMHVTGSEQKPPAIFQNVLSILLWILGTLMILSNLGVNVTSLIAGLGIGGVAFALASQRILADIFSSFSIYFDKPFREGDYIVTGDHSGFVRKIGLKTTRIQAVQGEEVIIPNQELTQARVRNYRRMNERHVELDILVAPDTSVEKLRLVQTIIRGIIDSLEPLHYNRVTLTKISKAAITFTVVYEVKNNDHDMHMNLLQEINLRMLEEFRRVEIALG